MNVYKLADHLEKANYVGAIKSANMLRQQADRIAELEKLLSEMKYEKASGSYQGKYLEQYWVVPQTKPLSDEEIVQLKAEIAAYKKTNELLAQKIEQLEKELSK